ncbi:MAG: hypothetical protein GX333_08280 [Syntrophomonadaceae bacterium]|nr:hypothetical protein [Syntrophomonadaceae bacterium]
MTESNTTKLKKGTFISRLAFFLIIGWTSLLVSVFVWNCLQIKEKSYQEATLAPTNVSGK